MRNAFTRDHFQVDHENRALTCSAGHVVDIAPKGSARFSTHCRICPLRPQYTTAKNGRVVVISEHDNELVAARRAWAAGSSTGDYRQHRPMVE